MFKTLYKGNGTCPTAVVLDTSIQRYEPVPVGPTTKTDAPVGEVAFHRRNSLFNGIEDSSIGLEDLPRFCVGH